MLTSSADCQVNVHPIYIFVQVVATGVCHTDWEYLYENKKGMRFRPFPLVLGHEAAGIVESVGPQVTKFAAGKCHSSTQTS